MITDPTNTKFIYLVDDDADDCFFFEDALKEVHLATDLTILKDGAELMNLLGELPSEPPPPHVIFLDLNMPRKNGFECLKEIKETPKLKNIPIVIFSTTASETAIEKTYSLGADHYVCKPNSHKLLVKTIGAVLDLDLGENKLQQPKGKFVLSIS